MKALVIGLGSIGRRHVKNLRLAAAARGIDVRIDALRHSPSPLPNDVGGLIDEQVLAAEDLGHYDLAFVCNPSQLHCETLRKLADKADFFFVEKPVFTSALPEGELGGLADEKKYYVACPLRHTRVFAALRKFVSENPVYSVRAICSSYLPEWRPDADYRKLYSAQSDSGGVKLDLVHDFDYLFSLFGIPDRWRLFEAKTSHLEIAGPDVVSFCAQYPDKTLELHLDYFGRKAQRAVEIFSRDDTVRFDFVDATVTWLRSGRREDYGDRRNDFQMREIDWFLDFALKGRENINSIPFANRVISLITQGGRS